MQWIFDNDRPIYVQLVEKLKLCIICGVYKAGEKLLSVRELAISAQVNPNTMQKALMELESYGLVYTKRTSGRFVTEDEKLIKKLKHDIAKEKVDDFISNMKSLGFSKKEIIECLENYERNE